MKISLSLPILFAAGIIFPGSSAHGQANSLTIGDPAPALAPHKWVKGTPIDKLQKGQLYVVEFWATWCGPCKAAIPHLTEIAKEFKGQVEVIGIDVWETNSAKEPYLPKVEAFVKSQGAQMDYHVAADAPDGRLAKSWLTAFGEAGIPTSFVVDKEGKIAWIGHDPKELQTVLQSVVGGKFDVAAARAKRESDKKPWVELQAAFGKRDFPAALAILKSAIEKYPQDKGEFMFYYFVALSHTDPTKFKSEATAYIDEREKSADVYNMMTAIIANEKGLPKEIYQWGLTLVDAGAKLKIREALFLNIGKDICLNLNDLPGALRYAEAAVTSSQGDTNCTDNFRNRMKDERDELKKKIGG